MSKFLSGLFLLMLSLSASAQHGYHRHSGHTVYHVHKHYPHDWVVPAIIAGAIVYSVTRPPVVIQQQPVVVQPQPVVIYIDGVAYTRQMMQINGVWQEVLIRL